MEENNVFDLCKIVGSYINPDSLKLLKYYVKAGIILKDVPYDVPKNNPYLQEELAIRNSIYDSMNKKEYKNPDGTYKEEYDFLNYIDSLPNIYNITPYFNHNLYENKNKTRDIYDYNKMVETSRFANLNEIDNIDYSRAHPSLVLQLVGYGTLDFTQWNYDSFDFFKTFSMPINRALEMMCDNIDSNLTTCGIISKVKYSGERDDYPNLQGYNDDKIKDYILTQICTDRRRLGRYPAGWELQKNSYDGMRFSCAFGGFIDYIKLAKAKRPQIIADLDTKYTNPEDAFDSFKKSELHKTLVRLHKYMGCIGAIATFHAVAPKSEEKFYSSKELFDLAYGNPLALSRIDNETYKKLIDEAENCCQKYIYIEKYLIRDKSKQHSVKKISCSALDSMKHKNMIKDLAKKVNSKDYRIK